MYYNKSKKRYEKQMRIDGKRVTFTGATEMEVYRKIAEYETEKRRIPLFSEVAEKWWYSTNYDDGTERTYHPAYKRAIEHFGSFEITEITPKMLQNYLNVLGRDLAYKTVNNQKTVFSKIFDYAILELGLSMDNPSLRVTISNKSKRTRRDALTIEERREIEATRPDEFQLGYLILYTGCRLGEALALRYDDIYDGYVHINKAVHYPGNKPILGEPKTRQSIRAVPLMKQLEKRLNELPHKNTDYIIGGDQPLTLSAVERRWERFCVDHGMYEVKHRDPTANNKHAVINKPTIGRHQIRHEYATLLYEAGIGIKQAMVWLGHSNISTTMDVYTHIKRSHETESIEKLQKYLGEA